MHFGKCGFPLQSKVCLFCCFSSYSYWMLNVNISICRVTMNELCVNRVHFTQASLLNLGSTTEAFIGHSLSTSASNEVATQTRAFQRFVSWWCYSLNQYGIQSFARLLQWIHQIALEGRKERLGLFFWPLSLNVSAAFLLFLSTGRDRLCPFLSDSSTVEQVRYKQRADLFTFSKVGSSAFCPYSFP